MCSPLTRKPARSRPFPDRQLILASQQRYSFDDSAAQVGAHGMGTTLRNAYLFIRPIHFTQGLADFAYGSVGPHAVDNEGHGVGVTDAAIGASDWFLGSGLLESVQRAADLFVVAASA